MTTTVTNELANMAIDLNDACYQKDKEIARLWADNQRLLRGIRSALNYLNEGRDGDASFDLEALLAGSADEQTADKE